MAQTKIEMLLALKDRYSAVLKNADKNTESVTQRMKRTLGEVGNRFREAASTIDRNTQAAFTNVKRYLTDSSYRRASVLIAMRDLKTRIDGVKTSAKKAFDELRSNAPMLDKAIKLASNPIVLGVEGALAVGGTIKKAASAAMDWQKGMAEINVTAGLSQQELEKLSTTMLNIGAKNVAPLEEVPGAFNKIISAGLNADQALSALDPTLKAAKAGFVDIETVAKAGVNVMNASGRDINAVYDILFGTLQKGAANMGEIAAYLPKVVPVANNAGIKLEQTAGAFAFLTAQGQGAAEAATLLNGAFNSLSNPKLLGNFKAMGVQIYDAQGNMRPLGDIIENLAGKLDGLSDKQKAAKLASLGLDQTSASAFAVMTQDVQKFKDTLEGTANSKGALKNAYNNSLTARDQWGIAANNIKKFLIQAGQYMLPVITKMGEWAANLTGKIVPAIKGVKNFIAEWYPVLIAAGVAFAAMKANTIAATAATMAHGIATGVLTVKQWLLNAAMDANPIGLIIAAIAILVGLVYSAVKAYDRWGAALLMVLGPIGMIVQVVMTIKRYWDSICDAFTNGGFIEGIKQIGKALLDVILYPVQQLLELLSELPGLGGLAAKGFDFIKDMRANLNMIDPEKSQTESDKTDDESESEPSFLEQGMEVLGMNGNTIGGTSSGGGSAIGGADAVAGSAKQIKNITVNIDAFNKGGINAGNTQGLNGKSATDIDEWFTQMLLRTIRNLEMSY